LYYSAFKNDIKSLNILKLQGWRINAYDYDGRTALGIAASEGNLEAVRFLIENGASLDHRDARGNNALDDAIREKRTLTIEWLNGYVQSHKV
jgi:glutaminase